MGIYTHLPIADWRNDGWNLVGSGVAAIYQAINNDDDTKYIKSPSFKGSAAVTFPIDTTSVPDGAVITSVTVKMRVSTGTGSAPSDTPPSITLAVAASDEEARFTTRTIYPNSTISTFEVATYTRDALGLLWDIHRLNHIVCRVFSYVGILDLIRIFKLFCEVKYRVRPTVELTAPVGTVLTPSPVISWNYTQTDGDPQAKAEYKIFTDQQKALVLFNPETAAPVFYGTVNGDTRSVTLPTSINPNTYWVYVRSYSSFGAKSVWTGKQFTVSGPSPGVPGVDDPSEPSGAGVIAVVPDSMMGSAQLTLQDTSNLLSAQLADAETNNDGNEMYSYGGTITRETAVAYPGGSASWKIVSNGTSPSGLQSDWTEVGPLQEVTARCQFLTAATARSVRVRLVLYDQDYAVLTTLTGSSVTDATGTWNEAMVTGTTPATTAYARLFCDVLSAVNTEVHYLDHLGIMYGTNTPYSDGGHTTRNLLSAFYSAVEGAQLGSEAWTAESGTTLATVAPGDTLGGSGALANRMTYAGLSPSIALRAAGTVFTSPTSGANFTLNKPAGVTTGDLMIAVLTASEYCTLVPPVGWTLVNTARIDDASTDVTQFILKRTATGSEPSTWTDGVISVNAVRRTAVVVAYSGAADASEQFIGDAVIAGGDSTPAFITTPAVTNTDPNAWRVSAFMVSDDASGSTLVSNRQQPSTIPAIQYVGAGASTGVISGTSYTINKASGVTTNDVMIATVSARGNITVTPPSGWTVQHQAHNSSGHTLCVMTRVAGGSEPASWTGSFSGSINTLNTQCVAYRNVNTTTPLIANSGNSKTSSNYIDTPSVANTNSLAWRVSIFSGNEATDDGRTWTSNETTERVDAGWYAYGSFFSAGYGVQTGIYDSNGAVSTGSYTKRGTRSANFSSAGSWMGILNPLGTPPAGVANETTRATATVGSSNPWITAIVADSNGVVPTGAQAMTGIWSASDRNAMAGWQGLIKPAAAVVAGFAGARMATKVDVSQVPAQVDKRYVTVSSTFKGVASGGTPYLTVEFWRANQLIGTEMAQGIPFDTTKWTKSSATFPVPEGTTRLGLRVAAADRQIGDQVMWDRSMIAFGTDATYRPGASRDAKPIWSVPIIEYADDDGSGYTEWRELPGVSVYPPSFETVSRIARYVDHTVIPLTNRKYRAKTLSYGLLGDQFVSDYGPDSLDYSFVAENWWLKDIANPDSNIQLKVRWDTLKINTTNTATVFQPLGADKPVVLTEGYKGDTFSIVMRPLNHDDWVGLREMLQSGKTLFLQSDIDHAWWVRPVGDLGADILPTGNRRSNPLREVTVQFVEVESEE